MICTLEPGLFDDRGENIIKENIDTKDGCSDEDSKKKKDSTKSKELVAEDEEEMTKLKEAKISKEVSAY